MSSITTYNVRAGNAFPDVGEGSISTGAVIFTFGVELQEVLSCSTEKTVLKSKDMCLLGGSYFSASYRAYPGKVAGNLVFNSTVTKKPIFTNNYGGNNLSSSF